MARGDDDDDGVGFGRPPKKHQFPKGQSGNPKGRPKKSKNLQSLVDDELNRKVSIKEGGQEFIVSKRVATVKRLVNSAMGGDLGAIRELIKLCQDNDLSDPFVITPEDTARFQAAVRRLKRKPDKEPDDEDDGGKE